MFQRLSFLILFLSTILAGSVSAGGDDAPAAGSPLQGVEWTVEDVSAAGLVDGSRITMNFDTDGRVSGLASCNRYFGPYTLEGNSLTMGNMASTMMACPDALMEQERRFFEVVQRVGSFELTSGGALILHAGNDRITARQVPVP